MNWYLYLLECRGGSLYTGITTDVERRYAMHAAGKGARYTRLHPPERIALVVAFDSKSDALKAEYAIKRFSPAEKRRWIAEAGGAAGQPLTAHEDGHR